MGDKWLVDENIDVDIQQLQDFSKRINDEMSINFQPSFEAGIKPMLMVRAPFGAGGLKEGKFFLNRHDASRSAVGQMLGEAMRGLAALSTAAMSISAEYLTGDAFSQATNEDVLDAFSGVEGQKTLNDYWKEAEEGEGGDPAGAVPEGVTDPGNYTDFDDGPTPEMYQESTVGEGDGQYTIQGDNEDTHNEQYDLPDPEQH